MIRMPNIVGIQQRNPIAGGGFDAHIARRRRIVHLRLQQSDTGTAGANLLDRIVGRIVVDDDNFGRRHMFGRRRCAKPGRSSGRHYDKE